MISIVLLAATSNKVESDKYEGPEKTWTKWWTFWTTKQSLFHIKKDEFKQKTHLGVAGREQGFPVIMNAARKVIPSIW